MLKRVSLVMGLGPKHAELVEEDVFDSVPPSSAAQPGVATADAADPSSWGTEFPEEAMPLIEIDDNMQFSVNDRTAHYLSLLTGKV